MPRDRITAETHAERLALLTQSKAAAARNFDQAVLDNETGKGSKKAVDEAQAQARDIDSRIEALHRLRQLSAEAETEDEARRKQAERQREIDEVHALAKLAEKDARAVDKALEACFATIVAAQNSFDTFGSRILATASPDRTRILVDNLSHRFEGTLIVGHLRAAGVEGLQHLDDGMDTIEAMRSFRDTSYSGLVAGRIKKALGQASQDLS